MNKADDSGTNNIDAVDAAAAAAGLQNELEENGSQPESLHF